MSTSVSAHSVILVTVRPTLHRLFDSAAKELGARISSEKAVFAAVKKLSRTAATDTGLFDVLELGVVGYCSPVLGDPAHIEPIVIFEGKAEPISVIQFMQYSEYRIIPTPDLDQERAMAVKSMARDVAATAFLGGLVQGLIDEAGIDEFVEDIEFDPDDLTVVLTGNFDDTVVKQLPSWIALQSADADDLF